MLGSLQKRGCLQEWYTNAAFALCDDREMYTDKVGVKKNPPGYKYRVWAALRACRMSAKLFNCTPAQLPADLKANLVTMLQCGVNALEGYIRPGCVHLVRAPACRAAA